MTGWTASPRAISVTGPGGTVLVASAPYGMSGSKEWAERAKLMAAAPELLAALQGVLRVADRATDEFDAARAAIAKAGAQP